MNSQMSNLRAANDCVIFISASMVISDVRRWLQQCWDSEIVWEWECCIVNLIIILLWRNIRELVSAGVQASDQSVDHVWPGQSRGMRRSQPGSIMSRVWRLQSVQSQQLIHHTLQTPDTGTRARPAAVLQSATADNPPYSHYSSRHCSQSAESTPREDYHSGDNWPSEQRCEAAVYFISVTKLSPRADGDICPEPLTSPPVTVVSSLSLLRQFTLIIITLDWGSLLLRLSSFCHSHSLADGHQQACNYKIGSQDDRESSTNQNLDRSFKGKAK